VVGKDILLLIVIKSNYTLAILHDFNNIITMELFKATDESIHGQGSVPGTDYPSVNNARPGF